MFRYYVREKGQYFCGLLKRNISLIAFWQTVDKVLFDKVRLREKISLVENDRIHSDDDTVAKTLTIVT